MVNVLVTGGAGFIGSHLVDKLLEKGYKVRILDNLHPQIHGTNYALPDYFLQEVDFIFGDIRDEKVLRYALKDIDVVFHLAAETGVGQSMYKAGNYAWINVVGTATLWDVIHATGGVKKLILASSRAVYGEGTYHCINCGKIRPKRRSQKCLAKGQWSPFCPLCGKSIQPIATSEEEIPSPSSIYGITKLTQEQLCYTLGQSYKIPVVILRFFNVYGPRQSLSNPYTGILSTFLSRIRTGKPLYIYEDGHQLRDFVYVSDVVKACILAIENDNANFQTFNVGTGKRMNILKLARTLLKLQKQNLPQQEMQVTGQYRIGDIRNCYADISKIKSMLNFNPSIQLTEGLKNFINWAYSQSFVDYTEEAAAELESSRLLWWAKKKKK